MEARAGEADGRLLVEVEREGAAETATTFEAYTLCRCVSCACMCKTGVLKIILT